MYITLNHFHRVDKYDLLAIGQGDGYTVSEGTLHQAIQDVQVDTGVIASECQVNEAEGYAVHTSANYVTIVTVGQGNEHPIAQKINQARQALRLVHQLVNL